MYVCSLLTIVFSVLLLTSCSDVGVVNNPLVARMDIQALSPDWAPVAGGTTAVLDLSQERISLSLNGYQSGIQIQRVKQSRTRLATGNAEWLLGVDGPPAIFEVSSITLCGKEVQHVESVPGEPAKIQVTMPSNPAGFCDVVIKGRENGDLLARERVVRYIAPPTIDDVSLSTNPSTGNTETDLTGSGFDQNTQVIVNGKPCEIHSVTQTKFSCTAEPMQPGPVTVIVMNPTTGDSTSKEGVLTPVAPPMAPPPMLS